MSDICALYPPHPSSHPFPCVCTQKGHTRRMACLCEGLEGWVGGGVGGTLGSSRPPGYDLCQGRVVGHLYPDHGHPVLGHMSA